jgi:hydrogenase-4 component H
MVLKLIREVLKTGVATHGYPFAPIWQAEGYRGKPEYDPQQCIACGACTAACPPNALDMRTDWEQGTRTWSIFYGRCIYCARCEEVCPTGAIGLGKQFELAVFNKDDLRVQAVFPLASCCLCGRWFAPQKELAYVESLLDLAGLTDPAARERLHACPDCRRTLDVPITARRLEEVFDARV